MTRGDRRIRGSAAQDVLGRLSTQSGPRTVAPMWVRPLLTSGEWDVYTALWSYPSGSVFPTHQELCDRAWCERGTAADAVRRFEELGLLVREAHQRPDGSTTSNTYYLVEVPSAAHEEAVAARRMERQAEQDKKRKQRKARNRTYEARSGRDHSPDGGTVEAVPPLEGGTAQDVPPGYGVSSTSGGTADDVPGFGDSRTHETLGVDVVSKGAVRASASSEEAGQFPSEIEDQEKPWTIPTDFYPELSAPEAELYAELLRIRPDWSPRRLRQVLGSPRIRERSEVDWDLVRRAFRLGAGCRADPDRGRHGTVTPTRLLHDACPHWREALAQREGERRGLAEAGVGVEVAAGEPPAPAPRQAPPTAGPSGSPPEAYLRARAEHAERLAARRAADERAEQDRRDRVAEVMSEAGATG